MISWQFGHPFFLESVGYWSKVGVLRDFYICLLCEVKLVERLRAVTEERDVSERAV